MLTNLKRVFNFAFVDFYRNKGRAVAAIFVLSITMLLATGIFFMRGASKFLISSIENKIDIAAYFKPETSEDDILRAKDEILVLSPDIKNIEYISKDEALADFNERHKGNDAFARALEQVGENPFLPSL